MMYPLRVNQGLDEKNYDMASWENDNMKLDHDEGA